MSSHSEAVDAQLEQSKPLAELKGLRHVDRETSRDGRQARAEQEPDMKCLDDKTNTRLFARLMLLPGALLLAASPAIAQKTGSEPAAPPVTASGASGASSASSSASSSDSGTRSLNRSQADAAREQNAANAASSTTYNAATADYQAARTAAADAQARYEREMQAHRDAQAAYDAAYARWQADVAACRAGEHSRCQSQMPGSGPN